MNWFCRVFGHKLWNDVYSQKCVRCETPYLIKEGRWADESR